MVDEDVLVVLVDVVVVGSVVDVVVVGSVVDVVVVGSVVDVVVDDDELVVVGSVVDVVDDELEVVVSGAVVAVVVVTSSAAAIVGLVRTDPGVWGSDTLGDSDLEVWDRALGGIREPIPPFTSAS